MECCTQWEIELGSGSPHISTRVKKATDNIVPRHYVQARVEKGAGGLLLLLGTSKQ